MRLQDTEIKHGQVIDLVEQISRQYNVQTVAWVLLAAFKQIYSENRG